MYFSQMNDNVYRLSTSKWCWFLCSTYHRQFVIKTIYVPPQWESPSPWIIRLNHFKNFYKHGCRLKCLTHANHISFLWLNSSSSYLKYSLSTVPKFKISVCSLACLNLCLTHQIFLTFISTCRYPWIHTLCKP